MKIKSIPIYTTALLMFATACSMIDGEPKEEFRFDLDNNFDDPQFDESPPECLDDPIVVEVEDPIVLWPPNHEFHEVTLSDCVASVSGGCLEGDVDPNEVLHILSVTSDEAENDNGDGNTCGDTIMITGDNMVKVLSERSGTLDGDGRVYTIWFGLADESGGEQYGSCEVHVPLGPKVPVVNSECQLCVAEDENAAMCGDCKISDCE